MAKNASKQPVTLLLPAPSVECPEHMDITVGDKTPNIISAEMNSSNNAVIVSLKVFIGSATEKGCGTVTLPDSISIDGVDYWINLYNPWKWSKAGKRYKDGRPSITLSAKQAKEEKKVLAQDIPF